MSRTRACRATMIAMVALAWLPACLNQDKTPSAQAEHTLDLSPRTPYMREWSDLYTGLNIDFLVAESPHGGLIFVEDSVYWFSGDQLQLESKLSKILDEPVATGWYRDDQTMIVTHAGTVGIIAFDPELREHRQSLHMHRRERGFPTGFAATIAPDLRSVTFMHGPRAPELTRFERLDDGSVIWQDLELPKDCGLPPLSAAVQLFDLGDEQLLVSDSEVSVLVGPERCESVRSLPADMVVVRSSTGRPWALSRKDSRRKVSYEIHSFDNERARWTPQQSWTTQIATALDAELTIADDRGGEFVFACHGQQMIRRLGTQPEVVVEPITDCPDHLRNFPGVGWYGWTKTLTQTWSASHPEDPPTPLTETFGLHNGSLAHLCLGRDALNLYTSRLDHLRWAWREDSGSWEFIDHSPSEAQSELEGVELDCGPKATLRLLTTDSSIRALDQDDEPRPLPPGSRHEGTYTSSDGLRAVAIISLATTLAEDEAIRAEAPRRYQALPIDVRDTGAPAFIDLDGVRGPIIDGAIDNNGHFLLATISDVYWYDGVGLEAIEFPDSAAADGAVLPRAVAIDPSGTHAMLAAFGSFVELEYEREGRLWIPDYEPSMASSMIGEVWLAQDAQSAWAVDMLGHLHQGSMDQSGERRWVRRAEENVLDFNLLRSNNARLTDLRFPRIRADASSSRLALLSSGDRLVVTRDIPVPRLGAELVFTADERLGGQLRVTGDPSDLQHLRIESVDLISDGERERITPSAPIVEVSEDAHLINLDRQLDDRLAGRNVTLELTVELDEGGSPVLPLNYAGLHSVSVPALPEAPKDDESLVEMAVPAFVLWLLLNLVLLGAMLGFHSFRREWLTHWGPALLSLLGSKVLVKPLLTGVPPLTKIALRDYRERFIDERDPIRDFVEPRLSPELDFDELLRRIEDPDTTGIIWLIGPSGVGKSTVLAHLAKTVQARVMLASLGFGKLPQRVAVHLRDYGDLPLSTAEASRLVNRGRFVILLDALNELTEQGREGEQELHDQIEQLVRNNLVVITSQTRPYWQRHLPGTVAQVRDFSDEQASEFLGAETLEAIDVYLGFTFPRRPLLISFLRDYLEVHDRSPDFLIDVFESRFERGIEAEVLEAISITAKQTFLERHLVFASTPRLPLHACDALRKLGIISKSGSLYRFAHQQIRAFFVARQLFGTVDLDLEALTAAHREISINSWGDVFEFLGELTAKYQPQAYERIMWSIAEVSPMIYVQRIYPQSRRLHDTTVIGFGEDYLTKHAQYMRRVADELSGTSL